MKDIKFRVWDKDTKVILCYEFILDGTWYHYGTSLIFSNQPTGVYRDSANKHLREQYIGLKDKNGKEIYEGDICKNGDWENDAYTYNYRIEEVCYDHEDASFYGMNPNDNGMTCEIIGNIHENPELLET